MKKKIMLIFMVLITGSSYAQGDCKCGITLEKLIAKIETEYPGFGDKTKDTLVYNALKTQLIKEAAVNDSQSCFSILIKYTSFFRDPHISLSTKKVQTQVHPLDTPKSQIVKIDINRFKKNALKMKNEMEGIWKNDSYQIGIQKLDNQYVGFIIEATSKFWKPGEIKFKLLLDGTSEYYMQDHSVIKGTYSLHDKSVLFFEQSNSAFIKQTPNATLSAQQIKDKVFELNHFYFKPVTSRTSILKLPSFGYEHIEAIERLIEKNKALLENSENLIIDLRDNSGGTDACYYKLLPYIMTASIRTLGVEYLSTQTLIDGLEKYISTIKEKSDKQEEVKKYTREVGILNLNKGKFVNLYPDEENIWEVKPEPKSPANIVILTNNMVGSSAENLVMNAKQSKKVKIIGTPTYGGLDYASGRYFDFGCDDYQLLLPTFRSLRLPDYPIDNIGLQPDIYLDQTVKDWVKFAVGYLEN